MHNHQAIRNQTVPKPLTSGVPVRIQSQVIAAVDRKKPLGLSRTGYVNMLLHKAISCEPEPISDVQS